MPNSRGPLADHPRHHAVDADHGEQDRQDAEDREERGEEAAVGDRGRARDALLHGHEVVRGLVAVDLRHRVLDRPHQGQRVHRRRAPPATLRVWIHSSSRPYCREVLAEGDVDRGRRLGEEARDRSRRPRRPRSPAAAAPATTGPSPGARWRCGSPARCGSWPGKWRSAKVLLTTATHGDEATSRSSIAAAAQEPDAEGVEELGIHLVEVGPRLVAGLGRGPARRWRTGWRPHVHGQPADDAGPRDPGQRPHALEHLVVEDLGLRASPGSCPAASCRSTSCRRGGCRRSAGRSVSKPGRSLCSRRKPRIISPAPTSSTIDSADLGDQQRAAAPPATAARRRGRPSLRTSFRSTREARSAGTRPKTRLETTEIASAKASTRASTLDVAQQLREARRGR